MSKNNPNMRMFYSTRSPFARKAVITLAENGLEEYVELISATVSSSLIDERVFEQNPLGQIPTLILSDGAVIYDSVLICQYLDVVVGKRVLHPQNKQEKFGALQRQSLGDGLSALMLAWLGEQMRPESEDRTKRLVVCSRKFDRILNSLENAAIHFNGTQFDIGHVAICCALGYIDFRFSDQLDWRRNRPHLVEAYLKWTARPSVKGAAYRDNLKP